MKDVTFIAAVFLRKDKAEARADSVARHHPECELILCDNSPEPLWDEDSSLPGGVRVIRCNEEANVSAARNLALANVRTPMFCLLDDDCEITGPGHTRKLRNLCLWGGHDIACLQQWNVSGN